MSGLDDIFGDVELFVNLLNESFSTFFIVLKYLLVFMMFAISILDYKRYRGIYLNMKVREQGGDSGNKDRRNSNNMENLHLVLVIFYFSFGMGILLGYLTWVLMLALDLLPDSFFSIIMNAFFSVDQIAEPYLSTMNYIIGFFSFWGFASMIMGLRFMILYSNKAHTSSLKLFISGIIICLIFGFNSFMGYWL